VTGLYKHINLQQKEYIPEILGHKIVPCDFYKFENEKSIHIQNDKVELDLSFFGTVLKMNLHVKRRKGYDIAGTH
jgi:hypothetical protein